MTTDRLPWNAESGYNLFDTADAQAILAIPLFNHIIQDQNFCSTTYDGSYAVKEGYRLCMQKIFEHSQSAFYGILT
jgi:hypothetical protein